MLLSWRHSPSLFCHVGRKLEQNLIVPLNFPNFHTTSTSSPGSLLYLQRTLQSSSTRAQRPIYQYLQQLEISSSSRLLVEASSDVKPVASPLMPVLGPSSGKSENQATFVKPSKVQAVLKGIQQMKEEFGLLRCAFRETGIKDYVVACILHVVGIGPNAHCVLVGNEGAKLNALHYIGEVEKPHSSCTNLIMDHNNQNSLLAAKGIRLNRSGLPLFNGHHSVMPVGNMRICHGGIAFFLNSRHSILPADNVRQYHSGGPCNMTEKRNIRDHKRRLLAAKHELRRKLYKAFCTDTNLPNDVRYKLRYKLSKLPRNSSFARVRNRCIYTGRPRAVYEDFRISRIMLRQLASQGLLNGIRKSSW